jgi:DNA-binding NarL/FixJ family response regulator
MYYQLQYAQMFSGFRSSPMRNRAGSGLSILIVDDHLLVRQGLRQVLGHEFRNIAFGEVRTAEEALAQIKARPWRLVILDIGLPDKDGFFVLQEIRTSRPETVTLMLSMNPDSLYAVRSLQLGAAGYVSKSSGRAELVKAVRTVLDGKQHFSESIRKGVDHPRSVAPHTDLSAQECKVMLAIATGKRTGEIAAEFGISDKTVSTYKRRVLNKLGLRSTSDLVRYVIENKLS